MKSHIVASLLACLLLVSSLCADAQVASGRDPNKWEQSIKDFERSDRTNPPPRNAVLFVGSSSIRIWTTLAKDFPDHQVINRGFGGSEIEDSVKYANRIVLPYRPRTIVFYAGDNDLYAGKTPADLFKHFEMFAFKVHEVLPKTKILFISVKPCPGRWHMNNQVMETNALIEQFCAEKEGLVFIDVYSEMLGPDAKPKPELFKKDGVHLTEKGYALWTSLIEPHLRMVELPPVTRR